ncbi:hypothetical protein [Bacillus atrophaeus]|uniref:hypothetical protein n=1 Tax=Bacillus atrophaeus TaxID=1452 RepID=UPI000D02C7F8|nr:hypothetical protein [Bacillus atrophaeus]PRR87377.1 hypothetical protein C6W23_18690 [Bacillus atrophaeus]
MKNNLQIELSFTDEFNQASRMYKSFDPNILDNHHEGSLGLLLEEFKKFLSVVGYCEKDIDRIKLKD